MKPEVVMIMGMQASGKTSLAEEFIEKNYVHLNRDKIGGSLEKLLPLLAHSLDEENNVLLDNTFGTVKSRKPFIDLCRARSVPIRCLHMQTSIEEAQFNAAERIIKRCGKLLSPGEMKNHKDPNIFPVTVLFSYQKSFELPSLVEGFDSIESIKFTRRLDPEYQNKALLLDYDGTLRRTKSGQDYPIESSDIEALPGRRETIQRYKDLEYILLGVSNQSGVDKGKLSHGAAKACFEKTNELVGHQIDYAYCPHGSFPIVCYCRKPMSGLFVQFMIRYKLDPSKCIMVGDMTSDKTFAQRSGIKYFDQKDFFI